MSKIVVPRSSAVMGPPWSLELPYCIILVAMRRRHLLALVILALEAATCCALAVAVECGSGAAWRGS